MDTNSRLAKFLFLFVCFGLLFGVNTPSQLLAAPRQPDASAATPMLSSTPPLLRQSNTTDELSLPASILASDSSLSAGAHHTCALTPAGGVRCWGRFGESPNFSILPSADSMWFTSGIQAVSAGLDFTCVLTTAGGVKCWGIRKFGRLGDNQTSGQSQPVDVIGLTSGVKAISAGSNHACALTTAGGVKCWGYNYSGQLGDGSTTDRATPVDVLGLGSGVQAIAAGSANTCALTAGGGVKCWGSNYRGALGIDTQDLAAHPTPTDVLDLTGGVQAITVGRDHTCALTTGGGVKCWGGNTRGELGDDTTTDRYRPVGVSGLNSGIQAISTGDWFTCALATSGVKCWGNNEYGQLGDGTTNNRSRPGGVAGLSGAVQAITTGGVQTCAQVAVGSIKCWGGNRFGELGDGTTTNRSTPVDVIYASLLGFAPDVYGYSFFNGLAYSPIVLGSTVHAIFGDSACWKIIGPVCIVRPEIAKWANMWAVKSTGGQCYGMSITSLRFFRQFDRLADLQESATKPHDLLPDNGRVQQHIMGYHIRQWVPEVVRRHQNYTNATIDQVVTAVEQGFLAKNPPVFLVITHQTIEQAWAHAIVPYKVQRLDEDDVRIYVYDSNYRGEANHYVAVKPKSDTWQYEFQPGEIWSTDLYAYPISVAQGPLPWETPTAASSEDSSNTTTAIVTASPGLTLRSTSGEPLESMLLLTDGLGPSPAAYFIPPAEQHQIIVDRTNVVSNTGSLTYIGPEGLAVVEGLTAAPVSDTLTLENSGNGLVYAPGAAMALTVTLSAANAAKDVVVTADKVELSAQSALTAVVSAEQASVTIGGNGPARYGLDMVVYSPDGIGQRFVAADVPAAAGTTQLIDIPSKITASIPFTTVVVDTGATQVGTLTNEWKGNGNLYLPLITR